MRSYLMDKHDFYQDPILQPESCSYEETPQRKQNVLQRLIIPKINITSKYIISELDEMEREESFRLKRFKQLKYKNAADEKEPSDDAHAKGEPPTLIVACVPDCRQPKSEQLRESAPEGKPCATCKTSYEQLNASKSGSKSVCSAKEKPPTPIKAAPLAPPCGDREQLAEADSGTCAGNVEPPPEPKVEPCSSCKTSYELLKASESESCSCTLLLELEVERPPEPLVEPKSVCSAKEKPPIPIKAAPPAPPCGDNRKPLAEADSCTCAGNVEPPPEPKVKPTSVCSAEEKPPTPIEAAPPVPPCGDNRKPLAEADSCTCAGNVEPPPEPEVEPKSVCSAKEKPPTPIEAAPPVPPCGDNRKPLAEADSCTCAGNVKPPSEPKVKPKSVCSAEEKPPTPIEAAPPVPPCGDNRKPLAEADSCTCAGNVEPPPEPKVKPKSVCSAEEKPPTPIEAAPPVPPCSDNRKPLAKAESCTCAGNVEPPSEPEVDPKPVCSAKEKPPTPIKAAPTVTPCGDNRKPLAEGESCTCAGNVEQPPELEDGSCSCMPQTTDALLTPKKMERLELLKKLLNEVIRTAGELEAGRKSSKTDGFLKRCHDVKNKIEMLSGDTRLCQEDKKASKIPRPGSAASSVCGKSPDNVTQSDSSDNLGPVLKTFKETIKITRSKNQDGTLNEKKTIITIQTEKRTIKPDGEQNVCGTSSLTSTMTPSDTTIRCGCRTPTVTSTKTCCDTDAGKSSNVKTFIMQKNKSYPLLTKEPSSCPKRLAMKELYKNSIEFLLAGSIASLSVGLTGEKEAKGLMEPKLAFKSQSTSEQSFLFIAKTVSETTSTGFIPFYLEIYKGESKTQSKCCSSQTLAEYPGNSVKCAETGKSNNA